MTNGLDIHGIEILSVANFCRDNGEQWFSTLKMKCQGLEVDLFFKSLTEIKDFAKLVEGAVYTAEEKIENAKH